MNSKRETSENERAFIIKWSKDGKSLREIASLIGKSHGCIQKILQKYRRSGCVDNIPGRGRKEIFECYCKEEDYTLSREKSTVKRPKLASSISSEIGVKISPKTVRRVLHNAGFHGRTPDFNDDHREEFTDFVQSIPGFQECDEEDVETWMACDAEDCGFQILNGDEIVTSVQEDSDSVDDETDEDEDNNNNEISKGPSNNDAFSALETAMEWYEQQ
ncbi:uncharacterized protein TNCV_2705211 [Trichonephila clavipes]|nr:uncharacterized protein TNCV_2705211 [Trichonephila clavipes]